MFHPGPFSRSRAGCSKRKGSNRLVLLIVRCPFPAFKPLTHPRRREREREREKKRHRAVSFLSLSLSLSLSHTHTHTSSTTCLRRLSPMSAAPSSVSFLPDYRLLPRLESLRQVVILLQFQVSNTQSTALVIAAAQRRQHTYIKLTKHSCKLERERRGLGVHGGGSGKVGSRPALLRLEPATARFKRSQSPSP